MSFLLVTFCIFFVFIPSRSSILNQKFHDQKATSRSEYETTEKGEWKNVVYRFPEGSAPLIDVEAKNVLIPVVKNESGLFSLYSYNADTGKPSYSFLILDPSESPNMLFSSKRQLIYSQKQGPRIVSFDLSTGRLDWVWELYDVFKVTRDMALANDDGDGTPILIYYGPNPKSPYSNRVIAIEYGAKKILWMLENIDFPGSQGKVEFTVEKVKGGDDLLYVINQTSLLRINTRTGEVLDSLKMDIVCAPNCEFSKVIVSDEMIIVNNRDSIVGVDKNKFYEKWTWDLSDSSSKQPIFSDDGSMFYYTSEAGAEFDDAVKVCSTKTGHIVQQYNLIDYGCVGRPEEALKGLKATKEESSRMVYTCLKEKHGDVDFLLFEGKEMTKKKSLSEVNLHGYVVDSSDCVYFAGFFYEAHVQKFCF